MASVGTRQSEVGTALATLTDVLARSREVYADCRGAGDRPVIAEDEALRLVELGQAVRSVAEALVTVGLAQVAAHEGDVDADTGQPLGTSHRGLGHLSVDTGGMVSGVLGMGDAAAGERVRAAVSMVTRMPRLVDELAGGRLCLHRASVMEAEALRLDGPQAAAAVDGVIGRIDKRHGPAGLGLFTAGELRTRMRRAVARISPVPVAEEARAAREGRRLVRWASAPGVDMWEAVLPCDGSRVAYAAITERARLLQREAREQGRRLTVDQARADALLQLIAGQSKVSYVVHVATPARAVGADGSGVQGPGIERRGLERVSVERLSVKRAAAQGDGDVASVDADTDASVEVTAGGARPAGEAAARVPDHGFVEVSLGGGADSMREPMLVPAAWLTGVVAAGAGRDGVPEVVVPGVVAGGSSHSTRATRVEAMPCDPVTGAVASTVPARAGYVPSEAQRTQVRLRDGHCRFPGCGIAARFCDLDHVIPWAPRGARGPTDVGNLVLLCRRHHRLKQTAGWSVRMDAGAVLTWTDRAGREHPTFPIDHLDGVHLPDRPHPPDVPDVPDGSDQPDRPDLPNLHERPAICDRRDVSDRHGLPDQLGLVIARTESAEVDSDAYFSWLEHHFEHLVLAGERDRPPPPDDGRKSRAWPPPPEDGHTSRSTGVLPCASPSAGSPAAPARPAAPDDPPF